MKIERKLINIQTPPAERGFLGPDHIARPVIAGHYSQSDPFIILMDDFLDKKNNEPVGGPHPHAGFETVSLLLEGEMGEGQHKMVDGSFQIMTAGSGIVHTETIEKKSTMRLLQLWLNLPKEQRWTQPRLQDLKIENVPTLSENGISIKVYSGSFAGLTSPIQNYTPLIVADVQMQSETSTVQTIPATFNTFMYVIEGSIRVGSDGKMLEKNQIGWLDRYFQESASKIKITAGESGARFVLYAGQPQGDEIVSYGPFIGDTQDDIRRLYKEYRDGKMNHVSTLPEEQNISVV